MRIVLAPDSFKESMSAAQAAAAMARGVHRVLPGATCVPVPMADGGEGTTDALVAALGGRLLEVPTTDALGRPVTGAVGLAPGGLAVLEVAAAVGIGLVAPGDRDVMAATSAGVAPLVRAALAAGSGRVVVGLGGSATNDGGAGLLVGLGARLLDAAGDPVPPEPRALHRVAAVDLSGLDPRLRDVAVELACDVTSPLLGPDGASAVFGPQKGASPEQIRTLDAALTTLVTALEAAAGRTVRDEPGAGAAGGLGAAFLALGATRRPGVEVVVEAAGLTEHVRGADLVLTGEGAVDAQTLAGKTPAGVAAVARRAGVPIVAFAGRVDPSADALLDHGFAAVVPILRGLGDVAEALAAGPDNLEHAVATTLRLLRLGATSALTDTDTDTDRRIP
ncbi:glycerate kinase [Cellulomonas triticagri]|uniref:Glycerate kinase n=1 Tax=Cellulomonas triticagri TaxID=2483352 RepID=A0A3M2J7E9_9CELL|nr:glycerate kinase [Cellulomonas triticagri]RMI08794.1 glycerate kinase [Cellulomonas triticagri]